MEKIKPGPAHERLLAFVGEWSGDEEISATPWTPAMTAMGRHRFRPAVEGLAVVHDYEQVRPDGQPFTGHGFFTVDPASGEAVWYFFDRVGWPPAVPLRGTWDGTVLTMTKITSRGEARHVFRFDGDAFEHHIDVRLGDASAFSPFLGTAELPAQPPGRGAPYLAVTAEARVEVVRTAAMSAAVETVEGDDRRERQPFVPVDQGVVPDN